MPDYLTASALLTYLAEHPRFANTLLPAVAADLARILRAARDMTKTQAALVNRLILQAEGYLGYPLVDALQDELGRTLDPLKRARLGTALRHLNPDLRPRPPALDATNTVQHP